MYYFLLKLKSYWSIRIQNQFCLSLISLALGLGLLATLHWWQQSTEIQIRFSRGEGRTSVFVSGDWISTDFISHSKLSTVVSTFETRYVMSLHFWNALKNLKLYLASKFVLSYALDHFSKHKFPNCILTYNLYCLCTALSVYKCCAIILVNLFQQETWGLFSWQFLSLIDHNKIVVVEIGQNVLMCCMSLEMPSLAYWHLNLLSWTFKKYVSFTRGKKNRKICFKPSLSP